VENEEFTKWAVIGANRPGYLDYMIQPNTTYVYRVRALGPDGPSAWSNELRWTSPPLR
jgi:hypothetical protein